MYRPNYKYRKVMIGLTGLGFDETPQLDLFNTVYNRSKELEPLMQAFDAINDRYGRGTIKLGCGVRKMSSEKLAGSSEKAAWELRRDFLSPCYTTNIKDIPLAY
jgi:DNA polymerase V